MPQGREESPKKTNLKDILEENMILKEEVRRLLEKLEKHKENKTPTFNVPTRNRYEALNTEGSINLHQEEQMNTQVKQDCTEPTDFMTYLKRKFQQEMCTNDNKKRAGRLTKVIAEDKRTESHPPTQGDEPATSQ